MILQKFEYLRPNKYHKKIPKMIRFVAYLDGSMPSFSSYCGINNFEVLQSRKLESWKGKIVSEARLLRKKNNLR